MTRRTSWLRTTSNDLSVFLGDGRGSFGPALINGVCEGPGALVIGRFDGDRCPDLALASSSSNQIIVLRGDGAGGFGGETKYQAGWHPTSLAVRRFDGDHHLDLAVAIRNWNSCMDGTTICSI